MKRLALIPYMSLVRGMITRFSKPGPLDKNGIRVINLEHHFATLEMWDEYYKTLGVPREEAEDEEIYKMHTEECDLDSYVINGMDAVGIDFAQLSLTTPGAEYFDDPEIGKRIAVNSNNALAEAIKKHPDRIGGYIALYPHDPEWSVKEIDRCVRMGLWGWCTMSNYKEGKIRLDDPMYLPILEKCNELKMPIFLHPFFSATPEIEEPGYCLNGPSFGFTSDTQLTLLRMIYRGIFDRLPNLKIILGHNAEGLAIYIDRIDSAYRQQLGQPTDGFGHINHAPSYYLRNNMVGDTSGSYSSEALVFTKEIFGDRNVVFGADTPYEDDRASVELVLNNDRLTYAEKKTILQDNALDLGFGVYRCKE